MSEEQDIAIVAEGLGFPEGPVVMADGSIVVVEIAARGIARCWGDGRIERIATGGGPNGAAIGPDGALYACNNGGLPIGSFGNTIPQENGRIERIDLATGKVERLYDSCDGIALSAPNDIVFDAAGGFWFTDLGKVHDGVHEFSGLYYALADGSRIVRVHRGVCSYNGVGLSPDGRTVYVADTFAARLYAYDADPVPRGKRRLVGTAPGLVGLDSLAVTAAGNICVAQLETGGITTFTPEGATSTVATPDPYTTNIAFGGDDMRTAWITLSATGRLARTRWSEPGLKLHFDA
jgi:gluconolactonase